MGRQARKNNQGWSGYGSIAIRRKMYFNGTYLAWYNNKRSLTL